MTDLIKKRCVPCEGGTMPLTIKESGNLLQELNENWKLSADVRKISREFKFKDFNEAMQFVGMVATCAEEEQHHPDICISYNKVTIELWTHAIGGLSENDFIVAAKIDQL